ncbi:histidine--tRNA ligase [Viridibacillus sp. YIM B01967]|uniref:Histidine--tRNA ligase n=2 Tax=Viridibacillus soli TaxID=2798301 RepID=A0ABS1HAG8_9BACL|nr:histidine--tRNA ligase [Viridibacillus soli]
MDYQNVKGTQDYLPEAEVIRRKIRRTLEDTFIQYGCKPLETPILNYTELMASKYGGGAEILEEMYTLIDRGERDLALRYDLTIPFAKVIAMNQTIKMPFKRYEIGKVFRDGPIKTGRFREFTQCDVDIVGVDSQIAEAELMEMALSAFAKLDLKIAIQYNNRKLLSGMLEMFEVPSEQMSAVILVLDKLEKVGVEAVKKELSELGLSLTVVESIERFLTDDENSSIYYFEPFTKANENIEQGVKELKKLMSFLAYLKISEQCVFNPFLARGLEIYTGTIYELFLVDQTIKSSIGSGGRYDNAIAGLLGTDQSFSTVGISFGLDVIYTALALKDPAALEPSLIDFYIIPMNTLKESLLVATEFRQRGYNVELDMSNKKLGKALERANKDGIRNVIVVGENEVKSNQITVKNMETGETSIELFQF